MTDPAIEAFFADRKGKWLSEKTRSSMTEDQKQSIERDYNEENERALWMEYCIKNAYQRSISSHPCTYSHSSARKYKNDIVTSIKFEGDKSKDGLLRSGNVSISTTTDSVGNAAMLGVDAFLRLEMVDGKWLIDHFKENSEIARKLISYTGLSEEYARNELLKFVDRGLEITSSKIKQVYFPAGDNYHLLSILSSSGIIFELKKRINLIRFSEETKEAKQCKKDNQHSPDGFKEIFDITVVGYGGTKPQNISVLNNQNGGKAYLLMSAPPSLRKRDIQFPKNDFFRSTLRYYDCAEPLNWLHKIFGASTNWQTTRKNLLSQRDSQINSIIDMIIHKRTQCRKASNNQYNEKSNTLPQYQRIWLCEHFSEQRTKDEEWLDRVVNDISAWIVKAYQKVIKKPLDLGPEERLFITDFVDSHREILR